MVAGANMLPPERENPVDPDQPILIWIKPPVNGVINIFLPVVLGEKATYRRRKTFVSN
jgi:hypothetical protein